MAFFHYLLTFSKRSTLAFIIIKESIPKTHASEDITNQAFESTTNFRIHFTRYLLNHSHKEINIFNIFISPSEKFYSLKVVCKMILSSCKKPLIFKIAPLTAKKAKITENVMLTFDGMLLLKSSNVFAVPSPQASL